MIKRTIARTATGHDASAEIAERLSPKFAAVLALAFGAFVLFGAGFAEAVHDTAHDGRHSFAFPCH